MEHRNSNTLTGDSALSSGLPHELFFLIAKFLEDGPCHRAAQVLREELEDKQLLPPKRDWQGNHLQQTFTELERKYPNVRGQHLLLLCERFLPLLENAIPPSVPGVRSLLGAGGLSALRTTSGMRRGWSLPKLTCRRNGCPMLLPPNAKNQNIANVLHARELGSLVKRSSVVGSDFYAQKQMYCRTLGHLSAVYCLLFDKSGRFIITGADDLLVKIWCVTDGRLLATMRGASSEITDIAVNDENTLLVAGSCDKIIRVWDLQTTAPVAVLTGHSGKITSVYFCPSGGSSLDGFRYLASTSNDGSVAFWLYRVGSSGKNCVFQPKPIQYFERMRPGQAQMLCASFSPGGLFLGTGSADHHVRVYFMNGAEGPERILEEEAHLDRVDSIQWANRSLRFISGSKDGTALVWKFQHASWTSIKLRMSTTLPSQSSSNEDSKRLKVTMVGWNLTDTFVITAVNDHTLKLWDSNTGQLVHILAAHKDEVFVIEAHPVEAQVVMSAGHDGQMIVWDIYSGRAIRTFHNAIEGQGHGAIFDAKWSPDGLMSAATDSHGHILIFGVGSSDKYKKLPKEVFFHTDYRPLIRDANHYVLDEQTQTAPHLMPPPFLVDKDGNPYPPDLQRLVPGRESCKDEQLVPNIVIDHIGHQEVIQGIPEPMPMQVGPPALPPPPPSPAVRSGPRARSNIDEMIEQLAQERGSGRRNDGASTSRASGVRTRSSGSIGDVANEHAYARESGRPVERRRQAVPPANGEPPPIPAPPNNVPWQLPNGGLALCRKKVVPPPAASQMYEFQQRRRVLAEAELTEYHREMARPPPKPAQREEEYNSSDDEPLVSSTRRSRRTRERLRNHRQQQQQQQQEVTRRQRLAYRTRANMAHHRDSDENSENVDVSDNADGEDEEGNNTSDFSGSHGQSSSSDSDSDSEYSDWTADAGVNLEPPERRIRAQGTASADNAVASTSNGRNRRSRRFASSEDEEDNSQPAENGSDMHVSPAVRRLPPRAKRKAVRHGALDEDEVLEVFRPPDWLSEVAPRKAPYYPQMGDEVVYFRRGHKLYVETVAAKKMYEINRKSQPPVPEHIKDVEYVKVIGIKYEIRPPRQCCLKLAVMNPGSSSNTLSDNTFLIKYHDVPDVLDFLVLKQTYDTAMARNWKAGDRFRCLIDDFWWLGAIETVSPYDSEHPDSPFLCFRVQWDNGEHERLSPWDLEPITEDRLPELPGNGVAILPSEISAMLYQPRAEEWPNGDRDSECERIAHALEQVMQLSVAEAFVAPVDLNQYPLYALVVEYPIDLSTIKSRLENRFYRRVSSVQFDVRYVASNAEAFNVKSSDIVKHARIITELCLKIIRESDFGTATAAYHELMKNYRGSDAESDGEARTRGTRQIDHAAGEGTSGLRSRRSRTNNTADERPWQQRCRDLLEHLWHLGDAMPFREPVDHIAHPDYHQVIDTPMDLLTVKEDLMGGNYQTPQEFAKDMRLIFTNSKTYNTNKRSPIYSMTLRLSARFEERMAAILSNWKTAESKYYRRKKSRETTTASPVRTRGMAAANGAGSSDFGRRSDDTSARPQRAAALNAITNRRRALAESSDDNESSDDQIRRGRNVSAPNPRNSHSLRDAGASSVTNGHVQLSSAGSSASRDNHSSAHMGTSAPIRKIMPKRNATIQHSTSNGHTSSRTQPPRAARPLCLRSSSDEDVEEESEEEENDNDNENENENESDDARIGVRRTRSSGPVQQEHRTRKKDAESSESEESSEDSDDDEEDDSSEEEEDEDEDTVTRHKTRSLRSRHQQDSDETDEERNLKRQHSDSEDSYHPSRGINAHKRVKRDTGSHSNSRSKLHSPSKRHGTRNQGRRTVRYREDSDIECGPSVPARRSSRNDSTRQTRSRQRVVSSEDASTENEEEVVSVSSRGRVRKLIRHGRGLFGD